ncbi:TPA: hypothetical protein ACGO3V_000927 [Streptococcus suis]
MKKLLYFLLFFTYIAFTFSTIFYLPFIYFSGLVGAMGVSLGLTYSLHQEVKKHPEKTLLDFLMWGSRWSKIILVGILLFSFLFTFVPELNWHRGLAVLLGFSYGLLWQFLLIQFLRKYYFKNA